MLSGRHLKYLGGGFKGRMGPSDDWMVCFAQSPSVNTDLDANAKLWPQPARHMLDAWSAWAGILTEHLVMTRCPVMS